MQKTSLTIVYHFGQSDKNTGIYFHHQVLHCEMRPCNHVYLPSENDKKPVGQTVFALLPTSTTTGSLRFYTLHS